MIFAEQEERGERKGDGEKKRGRNGEKETGRGREREKSPHHSQRPSASQSGCHSSTQVHSTGREKKRRGDHKGFETGPGHQISAASLCPASLITTGLPLI